MKCQQCRQELADNVNFCPSCGAKVARIIEGSLAAAPGGQKLCSGCGKVFPADHAYCDQCGRLLTQRSLSGVELMRIRMASKYDGAPTVGIAKASGDLILYDDRLEFKRTFGNALGNVFGPLGMAVAANSAPKLEVYKLREITQAYLGRYAGMMPMLVIVLSNGNQFSFCGFANTGAIQHAIRLIEEYRLLN